MKRIEAHRYQLYRRDAAPLNAQSSRRRFCGALIRVDGSGVACIHPWPELGDAKLDDELAALAAGQPLALGRVALECAQIDGESRAKGESLFDLSQSGSMPASHWSAGPEDDPALVAAEGFNVAKIKLGSDLAAAVELTERWAGGPLERLRLDFNGCLNRHSFIDFWKNLSTDAGDKIEFIEDPTPFDSEAWQQLQSETGVALAVDVRPDQPVDCWRGWIILKPTILSSFELHRLVQDRDPCRIVYTSYMDHAIGQMWAAYRAMGGVHKASPEAGILSHRRFAAGDPFFDRIRHRGPHLLAPGGTGLGFDDLLEDLPWQKLT